MQESERMTDREYNSGIIIFELSIQNISQIINRP